MYVVLFTVVACDAKQPFWAKSWMLACEGYINDETTITVRLPNPHFHIVLRQNIKVLKGGETANHSRPKCPWFSLELHQYVCLPWHVWSRNSSYDNCRAFIPITSIICPIYSSLGAVSYNLECMINVMIRRRPNIHKLSLNGKTHFCKHRHWR